MSYCKLILKKILYFCITHITEIIWQKSRQFWGSFTGNGPTTKRESGERIKCKTISLAGRCQQVLANPAIYCTTGCSYEWKARVMAIWHKRSPPTNIWKCKHTQKLTTWMEGWIKVHIIPIQIIWVQVRTCKIQLSLFFIQRIDKTK